ncbi:MAG: hypothetical protein C0625_08970 [Arcobacter sp.]|nr:MAG: hypothetical protein C0625_08970 [Arcobacter sp.]
MVIYIYGSESFKKDIHALLNHSNIKFRLDEHGEIIDLKNLDELKEAIEDNHNNIYLIDDAKIIKKNSLNQKIKFLKPKDGIEQEYLLDNGIGDISVDSIEELSKHIIKKLESLIHEKESNEIQESIVEIVEDAYEQDANTKEYIQLDDELSELLSHIEDKDDENNLKDSVSLIENTDKEEISSLSNELSFEEDLDNIEITEKCIESKDTIVTKQGDNDMADEFSQFDTLDENEILAALGEMDKINIPKKPKSVNDSITSSAGNSKESLDISGSNVNEIAELISKLLNNKTLEITVKVKD